MPFCISVDTFEVSEPIDRYRLAGQSYIGKLVVNVFNSLYIATGINKQLRCRDRKCGRLFMEWVSNSLFP